MAGGLSRFDQRLPPKLSQHTARDGKGPQRISFSLATPAPWAQPPCAIPVSFELGKLHHLTI